MKGSILGNVSIKIHQTWNILWARHIPDVIKVCSILNSMNITYHKQTAGMHQDKIPPVQGSIHTEFLLHILCLASWSEEILKCQATLSIHMDTWVSATYETACGLRDFSPEGLRATKSHDSEWHFQIWPRDISFPRGGYPRDISRGKLNGWEGSGVDIHWSAFSHC